MKQIAFQTITVNSKNSWELIETDALKEKEKVENGTSIEISMDGLDPPSSPEEPLLQEMDRGEEEMPSTSEIDSKSKVKLKPKPSPVVKTYPKTATKNKPPARYGWSLNPFRAIWI